MIKDEATEVVENGIPFEDAAAAVFFIFLTEMFYYSKEKKELIIKLKRRYIVVKLDFHRCGLPLFIGKYWFGLNTKDKTKTEWHIYLLFLLVELNHYGQLTRGKDWPKGWL